MPSSSNRSLVVDKAEESRLLSQCLGPIDFTESLNAQDFAAGQRFDGKLALADSFSLLNALPSDCFDLIIVDPPYNLTKDFHGFTFGARGFEAYFSYIKSWMGELARVLRPGGTMYVCAEWRSSSAVQLAAAQYLNIQNRITWEREKGRGAQSNWKNASEDIWFCTKGDNYYFDVEAVKMRRLVLAPYRDPAGGAKGWTEDENGDGGKYRDTFPSNLWTDLTVPFWSMPENTVHPTQKPEKLVAKLLLASSKPADLVFDPFAGSGTSLVVAKKLGRRFFGIEQHPLYAALTLKRLELAALDTRIQGYEQGRFWERNSVTSRAKR